MVNHSDYFLGLIKKSLRPNSKSKCEMHVNFLNLVVNFLKLRLKGVD